MDIIKELLEKLEIKHFTTCNPHCRGKVFDIDGWRLDHIFDYIQIIKRVDGINISIHFRLILYNYNSKDETLALGIKNSNELDCIYPLSRQQKSALKRKIYQIISDNYK